MRFLYGLIGFATVLASGVPIAGVAQAQSPPDGALAIERAAIGKYQAADQRLQDIGWKLVRGNAPFCSRTVPSIGLQLQDLASYGDPAVARAALGFAGDFAVQTSARGSPSSTTGAFAVNREIAVIGDTDPNDWDAGKRRDWRRLARAHDHIDRLLASAGQVVIGFADGSDATVRAVPVCVTRFELMSNSGRAVADGNRVVIGMNFSGFAYEEARLAAVVAHELAHNVLGHKAWLDENGRSQRNRRVTEREADRLMPWLLANAGYDPRAAVRFMTTWGPGNDGWIFRNRSHDGWDERAEFIAAEIPRIDALLAFHDTADWSVHFKRAIDPVPGAAD